MRKEENRRMKEYLERRKAQDCYKTKCGKGKEK